jgi:hypothetical protein
MYRAHIGIDDEEIVAELSALALLDGDVEDDEGVASDEDLPDPSSSSAGPSSKAPEPDLGVPPSSSSGPSAARADGAIGTTWHHLGLVEKAGRCLQRRVKKWAVYTSSLEWGQLVSGKAIISVCVLAQ